MRESFRPGDIVRDVKSDGRTFDEYRIEQVIAVGDKSQVYIVTLAGTPGTLILKRLVQTENISWGQTMQETENEFRMSRALQQRTGDLACRTNAVCSISVFFAETNGFFDGYIVFPYNDTITIDRYAKLELWPLTISLVSAGRLFEAKIPYINLATQLLEALSFMHAVNLVHSDIKPENVVVERGTGVVRLIDFGLSCTGIDPLFEGPRLVDPGLTCRGFYNTTEFFSDPHSRQFGPINDPDMASKVFMRYDIYQVGLVIIFMADADPTFTKPRSDPSGRFAAVYRPDIMSDSVWALVSEMTGPIEERRSSWEYAALLRMLSNIGNI